MLLTLVMCFSTLAGIGTTALAADATDEVYLIAFPRSGDANYSGEWGHDALTFKNGWSTSNTRQTTVRAMGNYFGNIAYCIEVGVPQDSGDRFAKKGEDFWNNYPSSYNDVISPDDIKLFIGRILQYGYTGTITDSWRSQNEEDANRLAYAYATQLLIWETVIGERDENFGKVGTGSYNAILDQVSTAHPLYSRIMGYYNSIAANVQIHSKVPSFFAKSTGKAQNIELGWNGAEYTAVLTDSNNVLGNYNFSSSASGISFSVSGNKLTITAKTAPSSTVSITATKKESSRRGVITWTDGIYGPRGGLQDVVTYAEEVNDPVKGYLNIKVSYGSAKIVKTSEDGKVDGISFSVQGNGVDKTVITNAKGEMQIDNLMPGVYTVTESVPNKYEPQNVQRVTVISGQTATVTFNNVLKRGSLQVTKTSEDGLVEGMKFHLYGTSLSGLAVDEYAVTDKSGVAKFENVLIGTGYTLEEVDTAIRYVIPDSQTAAVEWNKVTNKSFANILKKWNLTVTKSDVETGTPQGDASLSGAVYGIYKGDQLVDSYTTDVNGQFTTSYYVCGDDWSVREISPSEGYLLDTGSHHIGAEAKLYTVEYNLTANDVTEKIIKGNIALIKHTDDGSTQIETPEVGAEFEVYLKSAGSYANAKAAERDILVCDEFGFAQTKDMPYGVYTVRQTKGWEGRELMPDFDVYIAKDGESYRYLINNANFESHVKIVKVDAETGKTIPYAGAGFQIYDPAGNLVTMSFTYPEYTELNTFYTAADGMLITPQTLEYGKGYSIVEVQAPYGYVRNSEPVYFDVTSDNSTEENAVIIIKVEIPNIPQKGRITVTKSGEAFATVTESEGIYQPVYEANGLAGAVYTVTAAEDVITPDGTPRYSKGYIVAEITTGADGSATTEPLYLGKFEVCEKTAPYGMVLNDEIHEVELTYAGQEISITETATEFFNGRQRVAVSLKKLMEKDDTFGIGMNGEIAAVTFGLFAAEDLIAADGSVIPADGLIEIISCDEDGKAAFAIDIPVESALYVREISTDSHYILSSTKYPVVFEYEGQNVVIVHITANGGEPITNDLIRGRIEGLKIDRETEEPIAGALFGLFKPDETDFTTENALMTAVSQDDGGFSFEDVPYGDWIIRELMPAEGFLPNDENYPVTISDNEEVIEITVVNDRIPEIGTTATVDGEKEVNATEIFTLEDVVEYKHLIPGKEYVLKGVLMDKSTGKPLLIDGQEVRSETLFIPDEPSGSVAVTFTFDAKYIKADTDIVVFEGLYKDGVELAVHADIDDEGQTVKVRVPKIGTKATMAGKKEVVASGNITIDDVVSYTNLTPGKEYTVKGVLMDKSTGQPLMINGEEVHAETTFIPETAEGEVTLSFTFDASGLTTATEIVVFERLYRDGIEIAIHADIDDEGQTVTIIPPIPDDPKTGDDSNIILWLVLAGVSFAGIAATSVMAIRKRKEREVE